jgi:hypothetical protein
MVTGVLDVNSRCSDEITACCTKQDGGGEPESHRFLTVGNEGDDV